MHQADVIATLAEIFGAKLPDNAGEDSFSLVPLLRGDDRPVREHAVSCAANGVPALRSGSWKILLGSGAGGFNKDRGERACSSTNLATDLGEKQNLAAAHPDRVTQMQALLEKLITDGRSTPGAKQQNDVEVRRFPREEATAKPKPEPRKNVLRVPRSYAG